MMDDGDVLCSPALVLPYLQGFDPHNVLVGAERTPSTTDVMYYTTDDDLQRNSDAWRLAQVHDVAQVSGADQRTVTLEWQLGQWIAWRRKSERKDGCSMPCMAVSPSAKTLRQSMCWEDTASVLGGSTINCGRVGPHWRRRPRHCRLR